MIKKAKKKNKIQKIQITENDGVTKVIGKYDSDKKEFSCIRIKSEHFMRKYNAWGLDTKVVEFLIKEGASISLKDKETKWEYKCEATEFSLNGILKEFNQHRPQYFLPLSFWEVTNAKNRSMIIECLEVDCRFNFGNQCVKGTITISNNGECAGYEDRQD